MRYFLLPVLMVALLCGNLYAQESEPALPPIVTDRPDQTEAAVVVPIQHLQLETGTRYAKVSDALTEFLYTNTVLRYGVLTWMEFRLGQDYGRQQLALDGGESEEKGFFPLMLGTKLHLLEERGLRPETALLYEAFLPTGSSEFMPDKTTHSIRGLFSHTLSESISVGYNVGVLFPNEHDELTNVYTLSFGFELTDRLGLFTEVYGFLQQEEPNQHAFDGGFTYLLRPNLQLDVSGGAGLTESAENGFVSAGFSWRIPR
jgi:hypothetical protein